MKKIASLLRDEKVQESVIVASILAIIVCITVLFL